MKINKSTFVGFVLIAVLVAILEAYQWRLGGYAQLWFWRAYVPIAIFAIYLLVGSVEGRSLKLVALIVGTLIFIQVAFLDQHLAKKEFKSLCEQDAGIHIYKTVSLSDDQFDSATGQLLFRKLPTISQINEKLTEMGYQFKLNAALRINGKWGIYDLHSASYVRRADQAVMGESTDITWEGGGPLILGFSSPRIHCDSGGEAAGVGELAKRVFVKEDP